MAARHARSRCSRRSCSGERASSASCSRRCASRASSARTSTASSSRSRTRRSSIGGRTTRSRVVVDRLVVRAEDRARLTDSIETALKLADGLVEVVSARDRRRAELFSEKYGCPVCGISLPGARAAPLLVQLAVRRLHDLRRPRHAPPRERGAHPRRSAHLDSRGRHPPVGRARAATCAKSILPALARQFKFDLNTPWGDLPQTRARRRFSHGEPAVAGGKRRKRDASGKACSPTSSVATTRATSDTVRMELEEYMIAVPCDACGGRRLKPESLAVTVADRNIGEVVELPVTDALAFFESVAGAGEREAGTRSRDRRHRSSRKCASGCGSSSTSASTTSRSAASAESLSRRRGAAHPARDADRVAARRRAVHPRRAVDRTAPARQRAPARDARAAARSRQHGHRRRARRGDDARRRPRHRPRARRRQARRRGDRGRHGRRDHARAPQSLTGRVPQRRARGSRSAERATAARQAHARSASQGAREHNLQRSRRRDPARRCSSPSPACRARASPR